MNIRSGNRIVEVIASLFIFLFVYVAISKLVAHELFRVVLSKSPLLTHFSVLLSWLVPIMELLVSALLFVPRFRSAGLLASFLLMMAFTVYIGYMLSMSSQLPCSCGGVLSKLSWRGHFWFNMACTLLAAIGLGLSIQTKDFIAINRTSRKPV
jgi:hypothetical protein